jgi:hypothetical protein
MPKPKRKRRKQKNHKKQVRQKNKVQDWNHIIQIKAQDRKQHFTGRDKEQVGTGYRNENPVPGSNRPERNNDN